MADDLSLLFRLRAENTQAKAALSDTRQAVAQLRQAFGPQLTQSVTVANSAFSKIDGTLQTFVAQRVPLVGGAVVRVTEGLRNIGGESAKTDKAIANVARSIQSIATQSGKSVPQIATFLARFSQLKGQTEKNDAAFKLFGGSVDLIGNKTARFLPELEKASTALGTVAGESAAAGASIAAMAGPIGIAVLAIAALAAGAVVAGKQIFQLTKYAADFQGKMIDLAQQTGVAVETLSALEILARRSGGELGSLTQALVAFQRQLDEAQNPLSKTAELFRKFNIDTSDTETSLRSTFAALAAMPEGFAQTNAAAELFGARGGKQFLAILKESNGNIDGAIEHLREMGILISTDAARAADKFNDDLELLNFQLRALAAVAAEDLIPVVAEMIRSFGDLLHAIRPVISALGSFTSLAIRPAAEALKGLSLVVQLLTRDYKGLARAIKEARDAENIEPIKVPGVTPIPLPGPATPRQAATETADQAEAVVAAVKRRVAETNQALDSLFQQGRRNIEQRADEIIAGNKKILDAERDRIDAQIGLKQQEVKALDEAQKNRGEIVRRDTDDYRAITKEVEKLQQERLDKESEFNVQSAQIRARAGRERADATRSQIQNETDLLVKEFDRQTAGIEAAIKRGAQVEEDGLTTIELLEKAKIDERIRGLERQKAIGFLTIQEQENLNEEIKKLTHERDRLGDEQRDRRLQRERDANQRGIDIAIANLETLIQVEQIAGQRRIDTLRALADLRVLTEEEAAKKILQIQLDLIDDEIETTKSKLTAAGAITDKGERVRVQADLNNQIKILTEQRKTIQANGDREIDEGRQKDLENERRYADELKQIRERIRDVELETAREVINLMLIHFASRREIIKKRIQLDLDEENTRHEQANQTLRDLERENRESKKSKEEKLEFEKELNRLREAEAERHRLAMQGITDQGKKDEITAGPFGGFDLGIKTGQLAELKEGVQSFADVGRVALSALGAVVNGVAQGVGQLVHNWVLLGTTGPAAMRKLVASVLAGVAAQAATQAIYELAIGFAALTPWGAAIYGPAAMHFKAAALLGSIAAVAGAAGRGVAGGLFQQGGGGSGDARSGSDRPGQLDPLKLERNTGQREIVFRLKLEQHVQSNDSHIIKTVVKDFQTGGDTRQVINSDGVLT